MMMSEYPTSSAIQDLALRMDSLTYEATGIGHQLGRIADFLTGQSTGFGPQPQTTADDSVQSSSPGSAVDPEEPSPPQIRTCANPTCDVSTYRIGESEHVVPQRLEACPKCDLVGDPVQGAVAPVLPVEPLSGYPYHTFKPNPASHLETCGEWFGPDQCGLPEGHLAHKQPAKMTNHADIRKQPTVMEIDRMLHQVVIDRMTPYWADRSEDLDAVESYLNSLKDHLA